MISIIHCDDHKIIRAGIKEIISEFSDLEIVAGTDNGESLINLLRDTVTDVVIMDISLPGRSGLEVIKQIKIYHPDLPVLVLSMHAEEQYALRMLRAGASGYLHKDSSPEELVKAIRTVAAGNPYFSPYTAKRLVEQINRKEVTNPHELLSDREYDILLKFGGGNTISEIADLLSISVKTVSTYKARIMNKMHFNNNAEMIQYVMEHHLNV